MSLRVYPNGYALVTQSLVVDPKSTSIQVPLVAISVYGLVATDQNGSPLSYGPTKGSNNITVYTLGATGVTVRYDTDNLTSKQGTVWTVAFTSEFNLTLILPQSSTVGSVSGTPYSINETNMVPEMSLSPGNWKVSYEEPLVLSTSTVTGTTGGTATSATSPGGILGGGVGGIPYMEVAEAGGSIVIVVVTVLAYRWWKKGGIGPVSKDLRPDDVQVLNFIQEKGGKVLEPEIRMRFALPKTSAWRQIKRLERLGYVKVTKIGSQNQIEILKERGAGA
jgi:uncharacterized membrane protein